MILKKYKVLFLPTLIFFSLLACKKNADFLTSLPHDKLTDESYWTSENDALSALTTCYINGFGGIEPWVEEAASDNSYGQYEWFSSTSAIADGTVNPYSPVVEEKWGGSYGTIRSCNLLLENIDKIEFTTDGLKERIIAETRFIRAWQYLYLAFHFENVPIVEETLTVEESKEVLPSEQKDVYEYVIEELDAASEGLPVSYDGDDAARATKGACYALKARAYLYQDDFANVLKEVQKIEDLNIYQLNTEGQTPYDDLFSGANQRNAEVVFSVNKMEKTGKLGVTHSANAAMMMHGIGGNDPYFTIYATGSLADAYPMADGRLIHEAGSTYDPSDPYKDRDPRFEQSIFYPGSIMPVLKNGEVVYNTVFDPEDQSSPIAATATYSYEFGARTGLLWKKYLDLSVWGFNNNWENKNDVLLIRYAEIILMKAEALLEENGVGSKTEVIEILNELRDRVGGGQIHEENYNSEEELMRLVRNERRVELANEGLRYFDLIRWKAAEKDPVVDGFGLNGVLYGAFMRLDGDGKNDRTIEIDGVPRRYIMTNTFDKSKRYLLPIPQKEIDLNDNLQPNSNW